jgi:hypothetical protein
MNYPVIAPRLDISALDQFKQMQISDIDDFEFEYASNLSHFPAR